MNSLSLCTVRPSWTVTRGPSKLPTSGGSSKYTPLFSAATREHADSTLLEAAVKANEEESENFTYR